MPKKYISIRNEANSDEAVIDIEGAIGVDWWTGEGNTAKGIKEELKQIANMNAKKIIVNINSLGGDVNEALAIHDALVQNKAEKIVRINGMTASSGTIIAMAGNKIEMSENALFLVHRASWVAWGNKYDMENAVQDLEKIDDRIINLYHKRTGRPIDEIVEVMDRREGDGEWLSPNEAKEFGFIDEVFEPKAIAASVDFSAFKKLGLPEVPKNKINPKYSNEMKKGTLQAAFNSFKNAVNASLGIKNEVETVKTKDGKELAVEKQGAEIAVGDSVTLDGQPTPDASYDLDNGKTLKTDADSKVSSYEETVAATNATPANEGTEPTIDELKEKVKNLETENATLKTQLQDQENEITEVTNSFEAFKATIVSKGNPPAHDNRFRNRSTSAQAANEKESKIAAARAARKEAHAKVAETVKK